jgi:uncharacterized protein (TIGR02217 family)
MGFHEIRFPAILSFGSVGGPERLTEIVALASGHEERNSPWAQARRRYDAGVALRSLEDIDALIAFFEARQGQLYGFRWKDWSDFKSGRAGAAPAFDDQRIGVGDDATVAFQLFKTYRSGAQEARRPVVKPVRGSVRIGLGGVEMREGVHYEVDDSTGIVTFSEPPNRDVAVTAGYEFDVPVRFDTDRLQVSMAGFRAGEVPSVPVVEIRL